MDINFIFSKELKQSKIFILNLEDIAHLLKKSLNNSILYNDNCADFNIEFLQVNDLNTNFKINYNSIIKRLNIIGRSPIDIIYGTYFFLSEILNFFFLHPEEISIPQYKDLSFLKSFNFEGEAKLSTRGTHLHTLHPIELAHFLYEENAKHLKYIENYIKHLVRTGNNTFQFYLLEKTNLRGFANHLKDIIPFAHDRGVNVGIMLSLFRVQQYSYKLVNPFKCFNLLDDCKRKLDMILEIPFDYVVIETPLGEFLPDLMKIIPKTIKKIEDYIINKKRTPLYYSKHIVRKDHSIMEPINKLKSNNESQAGFLFRTVMCYSLIDKEINAYENKNFFFVYKNMEKYAGKKKILFWPTAAYWVSFDNSIPLFLMPYFRARCLDVELCKKLKIDGHIIFSSGFEWGGFLVELATSNYLWSLILDETNINNNPFYLFKKLTLRNDGLFKIIRDIYSLLNYYLITKNYLPYITGEDPFIEFPLFNYTFQPRPKYSLKYARRNIKDSEKINLIKVLQDLESCKIKIEDKLKNYKNILNNNYNYTNSYKILDEIYKYIQVLVFRIKHRIYIYYAALIANNRKKLPFRGKIFLVRARKTRKEAKKIIEEVIKNFRYDKYYIYEKRANKTAYDFSYFYPAYSLFFWEREEQKILNNKFNPLFMKLWNFSKIIGLK
ncbi:MAG: hypothetical protein SVN78_06230 [Deferribacterota bacterium]|nr:hypothetical protein [Deferribacterota bacterium]